MLILNRKVGETINVGDRCAVTVIHARGSTARIAVSGDAVGDGFAAPLSVGETADICENATVTVLGINGQDVRLGVDAPKKVKIYRSEIYERVVKERVMRALAKDLGELGEEEHGAPGTEAEQPTQNQQQEDSKGEQ